MTEPTSRDSWLITLWKRKWLVIVPAVVSTVVTFVVTSVLPCPLPVRNHDHGRTPRRSRPTTCGTPSTIGARRPAARTIREQILKSHPARTRSLTNSICYRAERHRVVMEEPLPANARGHQRCSIRGDDGRKRDVRVERHRVLETVRRSRRSAETAARACSSTKVQRATGNPSSDNASQFLDGQAEDARRKTRGIRSQDGRRARASGRQPSKVLEVEFQALAEVYKSLLLNRHEASTDGRTSNAARSASSSSSSSRRESLRRRSGQAGVWSTSSGRSVDSGWVSSSSRRLAGATKGRDAE